MDPAGLRAAFPVFGETAYLNAGTCGPLPEAARAAAAAAWEQGVRHGRGGAYYVELLALRARLREVYAALLRADPADVALTTSTSEGIVRVLATLALRPGDEVLTSDDEHPGLLGPLLTLGARCGVRIRRAPLAGLADAVGPRTALVACSHVGWTSGALAPAALAGTGVPVLLDGAQGIGAIPVDVGALGCAFYAGSGQKWLCGPVGTGLLWIAPAWRERLPALGLTYLNLERPADGLEAAAFADARRHDAPALALESLAPALAALELLDAAGWDAVHERAASLAGALAERLRAAGRRVAPRGRTTLVAWDSPDAAAERDRLGAAGVVVRDLPGTPRVRASVGAWNDERDLERLLAVL